MSWRRARMHPIFIQPPYNFVSSFIFAFRADGKPSEYFHRPLGDLWGGEVFGGLSSFVLTWTLFYGLVRA